MPAYLYSAPSGIPGMISRDTPTVEPQLLDSSNQPASFGLPVVIDATSHKLRAVTASDKGSDVIGFLVRPYPFSSSDNSFGAGTPPASGLVPVMRRGYMSVKLNSGTAANNSPVFVRVSATTTDKPLGGIEASLDSAVVSVAGSNTGTGTIGTMSATASAPAGAYSVLFTAATKFSVFDPNGLELKNGSTGVAYSAEGLTFTATAGGTAFVAGDSFTLTVTQNTIQVPDATFTGSATDSNVELAFNI